jgi:transposase InsO family protein
VESEPQEGGEDLEERGQRRLALTKPMQNAFVESFQGKLRDECLNLNWFSSLTDARKIIELWRLEYNTSKLELY